MARSSDGLRSHAFNPKSKGRFSGILRGPHARVRVTLRDIHSASPNTGMFFDSKADRGARA